MKKLKRRPELLVGLGLLCLLQCDQLLPSCEILNAEAVADVFLIDGEFDAGYLVTTTVRNNGQSGNIHLKATITCSEGDFFREREIHFDAGQTRQLSFSIHEPTINAVDVQYRVVGWP